MQSQHRRCIRLTSNLIGLVIVLALAGGQGRAGFVILHNDKDFDFSNSGFNNAQQTLARQLFDAAMANWQARLGTPPGKDITLFVGKVDFTLRAADRDDGETGMTGNGETEGATATNDPSKVLILRVKEIDIATDNNMYYGASSRIPPGQRDAYSTMMREVGHAVGFNYLSGGDGYQMWNDRINAANGTFRLSDGTLVALAKNPITGRYDPNSLSHVDGTRYPNDLMQYSGQTGVRQYPSGLDLQMLSSAFGYTINPTYATPEPASLTLLGIGAVVLTGYGWRRRNRVA